MEVVEIYQTCPAFPSQWEGFLADGRMFYCRYRNGVLSVELSKEKTQDVFEAMEPEGELIYRRKLGGDRDGEMSTKDLKLIMSALRFRFDKMKRGG